MRKLNVLDTFRNKSELYIPILDGKTYLYWFETNPTNERLLYHEMYDLWKKQYDYLKSTIEVSGYTYAVGARTVYDTVAYDVNGNAISYFDIFYGAKIESIDGMLLDSEQLLSNPNITTNTTGWSVTGTGASITYVSGRANLTGTSTTITLYQTGLSLVSGNKYTVLLKVEENGIDLTSIKVYNGSTYLTISSTIPAGNNMYSLTFAVATTHTSINIQFTSATTINCYVDDIYLFNTFNQISNKQHSPLYATTFDLMSDAQIEAQMYLWVNDGTLPNDLLDVVNPEIEAVGKNLFDKTTSVSGYILASTGALVANSSYRSSDYIKIKPTLTYYSNQGASSGTAGYAFYDINKTFISGVVSTTTNFTFTTPSNAYYVRFCVNLGVGGGNVDTLQFELGSTATAYEEYISATQKFIGLDGSDVHLRRLPNGVKDTIEIVDGKAYWVKRITTKTFDGSGTWNIDTTLTNTARFFYQTGGSSQPYGASLFCSDFLYVAGNISGLDYELSGYSAGGAGYFEINILKSRLASVDATGFKAWLASNNITIYYALTTPVTTEIASIGYLLGMPNVTYYQQQTLATNFKVNKYTDIFNENIEGPLDSYYDLGWFASEPEQSTVDAWQAEYEMISLSVRVPELVKCIEPVGLGNRFKLLAVDDTVYGHELDFEDISFKMYFGVNFDAYKGYHAMMNMLRSNKAIIKYDWGIGPRYNDVRLLNAPKTEKDTSLLIISKFYFKRLNPFYELIEVSEEEDMKNESDLDSPVKLDLTVSNTTVSIKLLDAASGVQQEISFDFTGVSTPFNLTIDPETKKLLIDDITDAYDYANHTKDSFIYLPGDSEIYSINITGAAVNKITYKKWVIS